MKHKKELNIVKLVNDEINIINSEILDEKFTAINIYTHDKNGTITTENIKEHFENNIQSYLDPVKLRCKSHAPRSIHIYYKNAKTKHQLENYKNLLKYNFEPIGITAGIFASGIIYGAGIGATLEHPEIFASAIIPGIIYDVSRYIWARYSVKKELKKTNNILENISKISTQISDAKINKIYHSKNHEKIQEYESLKNKLENYDGRMPNKITNEFNKRLIEQVEKYK